MAISFRGSGNAATSFPLNPSYPTGTLSQDLNILTIAVISVSGGTYKTPVTPSGWTLLTSSYGDNWNTGRHDSSKVIMYQYGRVGAFSGSLGNITWTGTGSTPTYGVAAIDAFGCGASETWDFSVYSNGVEYKQHPDWYWDATASKHGINNKGGIGVTAGDFVYLTTVLNAENSGYPIAQWLSGGNITSNTGKYTFPGTTGTYVNLDNAWLGNGTGNMWEGVTLIRSYYQVTTAKAPFGSPRFTTPMYNPSNGFTIHRRVTLNQKSSSDARTSLERTKAFGLTSADTGSVSEGSRDGGTLNANPDFNEAGVTSWTAQNGVTLTRSYAAFINGDSSMLLTPNGVGNTPQAISEELTIIPNSYYRVHSWMLGNGLAISQGVFWYNASHTLIGSRMTDDGGSTSGVWKEYTLNAQAPPGARYARIAINCAGVLSAGQAWHVDEVHITDGSVRVPRVPYPRRWKNGEVPAAVTLNKDWRDTFNWLLGDKPWFVAESTDTTNWQTFEWWPFPLNVEIRKQYFIHKANDTKVYVPEDGWYSILGIISRDSTGAGNEKDVLGISVNGTVDGYMMGYHEALAIDTDKVYTPDHCSVYLRSGDYIELTVYSNAGAGTAKSRVVAGERPRLEIWWTER